MLEVRAYMKLGYVVIWEVQGDMPPPQSGDIGSGSDRGWGKLEVEEESRRKEVGEIRQEGTQGAP